MHENIICMICAGVIVIDQDERIVYKRDAAHVSKVLQRFVV